MLTTPSARLAAMVFAALLVSVVAPGPAAAEGLKRRALLGVRVEPSPEGVRVAGVLPGGAAEAGGLRAGDVIVSANGAKVESVAQFLALLKGVRSGDRLELAVARGGERATVALAPKSADETAPDLDVLYRDVTVEGARRRVIVTKPKAPGKYPAVLIVGGIGCYSIDVPFEADDSYRRICHFLTRNGFATMRVEKSGVGDSEGAPCAGVDFETEVKGYVEGLKALKGYEFVDPSAVFVFGHSIGGIAGPIVASREPVRGIAVAETVGVSWFEYELQNSRRQLLLGNADADEVERRVRIKERCTHRLFVDKQAPEQILKEAPECADMMQYPAHYTYMQQVADANLPALWKGLDVHVLAIYGASDFVTDAQEHRYLIDVVNRYHPGKGVYVEIPEMAHGFERYPTARDAFRDAFEGHHGAPFNDRLTDEVLKWLRSVLAKA